MKAKGNFYTDNDDVRYQLKQGDKLKHLFDVMSEEEKEAIGVTNSDEFESMYFEMLETVGEYAGTQLKDNAAKVESEDLELKDGKVIIPPTMQKNLATFLELGAHTLSVPIEHGGMDAPILLELAGSELVARACPSTLLNISWYSHVANIIHMFGTDEVKKMFIPSLVAGEMSGSMSLTEPDTGSDLANMRTYGEEQEDGSWLISGSKQFISNGSGGVSLVLAQNKKGADSLKTLSLFVVPQEFEGKANYEVTKIEEKPGLHGSATCALQFEKSKGWLLGKNGRGFHYMLHLMNEARLAVGFQGLGLMEACHRLAKDYADQRMSWGKPISQHEMICEKLLDMDAEIKTYRSLLYKGSFYASMIHLIEKRIEDKALGKSTKDLEKKLEFYRRKLRDWTPLLKWWAGERSVVIARNCLQIHGGYGFTKEYQPEQWVRESLILSIYEGTSEIQGLMCIKDTIKDIIRNPKKFANSLVTTRMKVLAEMDPIKKKYYKIKLTYLNSLVALMMKLVKENVKETYAEKKSSDIISLIKSLKETLVTFDNISPALLNASRICEMKAILTLSRAALEDMEIDGRRKGQALRFISRWYPVMLKNKAELEWDDEQVAVIAQGNDDAFAQASQG